MEHASLTGREVLELISNLYQKIGRCEDRLIRYRILSQKVNGGEITGMSFSPNQRTDAIFTNYINESKDLEDKIKGCREELDKWLIRVEPCINRITDVDGKALMSLRYLEGVSVDVVADVLNLSRASGYRKMREAKREFYKIWEKTNN